MRRPWLVVKGTKPSASKMAQLHFQMGWNTPSPCVRVVALTSTGLEKVQLKTLTLWDGWIKSFLRKTTKIWYIQVNSWFFFIVVMIFTHLFCLQKSKNAITASNETTADSRYRPPTWTLVSSLSSPAIPKLLWSSALSYRCFLQVGEVRVKIPIILRLGVFQQHLPKVCNHSDLQKWLAGKRLPDFQGSSKTTCGGNSNSTPASTLPLHPPAPVPCSPASWCVGFKALTFGKPRMVASHVLRPSKKGSLNRLRDPCDFYIWFTSIYMLPWMVWVWNGPPPPVFCEKWGFWNVLECSVFKRLACCFQKK